MKRLTLAYLLLSFCATFAVAGPAPQKRPPDLGRKRVQRSIQRVPESLKEFKEARKFMQLKATVLADLDRLESQRATKPKIGLCSRSQFKSREYSKRCRLQCHCRTE